MNRSLKTVLKKMRLYEALSRYYHMLRQIRPEYISKQLRYRLFGAPDGFRVPPPRLVFSIIARGWAEQYWNLGKEAAGDIISQLAANGIKIADFSTILDFGCGSGRVIRHIKSFTEARLFGTDYNPKLVRWCQKHLPFAEFKVNGLAPPLDYEDGQFDFIYLISVFTHLSGELQRQWMAELKRILQPAGIILFTTHGDKYYEFLSEEQIERFKRGEVVVIDRDEEGKNHFGSFESREFVERNLLDGFELISFIPGADNLAQDTYIVRKQ